MLSTSLGFCQIWVADWLAGAIFKILSKLIFLGFEEYKSLMHCAWSIKCNEWFRRRTSQRRRLFSRKTWFQLQPLQQLFTVFSMSSFFHDGVNEAFAESISTSRSKFSLFCLQKVIMDNLSNQEQKQFHRRQYQS